MIVLSVLLALAAPLHSCDEIAALACQRSRVIMMNEAHSGPRRMVRARRLGKALLPAFWAGGVRLLAAEALDPQLVEQANRTRQFPILDSRVGYLAQPEMREFFQAALDQGMDLAAYEVSLDEFRARKGWFDRGQTSAADERTAFGGEDWNRFRELNQAEHLVQALGRLGPGEKMLVWCGNGHLGREAIYPDIPGWSHRPYNLMGHYFQELSGIEPFCIDQTATADWPGEGIRERGRAFLQRFGDQLGGPEQSAGLLVEDLDEEERRGGVDALIFSQRNQFE